jgi:hypothetical protein
VAGALFGGFYLAFASAFENELHLKKIDGICPGVR